MEHKIIFDVAACAKDVIDVLEKHNATFSDMKEVFRFTKKKFP